MQLDGNAPKPPIIVFDSANVDLAVRGCVASKFRNAGQTCICSNRILIQSTIYDEFLTKLVNTVLGLSPGVTQGHLMNEKQLNRVTKLSVKQGAKVVMGGEQDPSKGKLFYKPTILTEVTEEMPCFQEEIFGRVVTQFNTEEVKSFF